MLARLRLYPEDQTFVQNGASVFMGSWPACEQFIRFRLSLGFAMEELSAALTMPYPSLLA